MPALLGGNASVAGQVGIELGDDMYVAAERLRTLLGPVRD